MQTDEAATLIARNPSSLHGTIIGDDRLGTGSESPDSESSSPAAPQRGSKQSQASTAAVAAEVSSDNSAREDGDRDATATVTSALNNDKLKRCVVVRARLTRKKPPWAVPDGQEPPLFLHLQTYNEHPFRYQENLIYLISADKFISTKIQEALIKSGYLNPKDLTDQDFKSGQINITECKELKLIGVYIKAFFDDRPLARTSENAHAR